MMHKPPHDQQQEEPRSFATMDRRTAIKASLTTAAAAGATFQPQVLGFVQPRKNLSGDGTGIFDVRPLSATVCNTVQITGRGFGLNSGNVLCTTRNGSTHFQPGHVVDQRILTQIRFGDVTNTGPLKVTLGEGGFATPSNFPEDIIPYGRFWAWRANGGASFESQNFFIFQPPTSIPAGEVWFSGRRTPGQLQTTITLPLNDDCCFVAQHGSFVAFSLNMQNSVADQQLAAQGQFFVNLHAGPETLAKMIGSIIVSTVLSITGIELTYAAQWVAPNQATLSIERPGFLYDEAYLGIRLNQNGQTNDCGSLQSQDLDSVSGSIASLARNSQSVSSVSMSVPSQDPCPPSVRDQCVSMSISRDFPAFLFR